MALSDSRPTRRLCDVGAARPRRGTVNLIGSDRDKAHEGGSHEGLCPSGHAGDLGPGLEGLGPGGSILVGGEVIAGGVEEVVDPVMGGEEALGLARRLEPLHLPLASSGRLMGVFGPVVQMLWEGVTGWHDRRRKQPTERPMPQPNDLSRSLVALNQDDTLIAVIEMSRSSWLVAGIVPGIARHPLKKLAPDEAALLGLLERWRGEATQGGRQIHRIGVAFGAGRDGFWLARWLRARGIEAYVIHPTSVAVSREHRRAKTDRLDTALLKRVFLGWLRSEPGHCTMAAIPTLEEEDARRPNRERESLVGERTRIVNRIKANLARLGIRGFKPTLRGASERLDTLRTPDGAALPPNTRAELRRDMARLGFIVGQIKEIEDVRQKGLATQPDEGPHAMVRLLARVTGIGTETAA